MTTSKRIHRIYGIALSVALIIAGICFMAACLNIYSAGGHPYSREVVAEQFRGIAVPVYIALAMTIGSMILHLALPVEDAKKKPNKNYGMILQNLWQKRELSSAPLPVQETIQKLQSSRRINTWISIILLIAGSIVFLIYGANPKNFAVDNINGSMLHATIYLLICLAIPAGFTLYTAYSGQKSMAQEIELVKSIEVGAAKPQVSPCDYTTITRYVILCIALAILIYGYFAGGTLEVLTKAANICTECVGLG